MWLLHTGLWFSPSSFAAELCLMFLPWLVPATAHTAAVSDVHSHSESGLLYPMRSWRSVIRAERHSGCAQTQVSTAGQPLEVPGPRRPRAPVESPAFSKFISLEQEAEIMPQLCHQHQRVLGRTHAVPYMLPVMCPALKSSPLLGSTHRRLSVALEWGDRMPVLGCGHVTSWVPLVWSESCTHTAGDDRVCRAENSS